MDKQLILIVKIAGLVFVGMILGFIIAEKTDFQISGMQSQARLGNGCASSGHGATYQSGVITYVCICIDGVCIWNPQPGEARENEDDDLARLGLGVCNSSTSGTVTIVREWSGTTSYLCVCLEDACNWIPNGGDARPQSFLLKWRDRFLSHG